MRFIHLLAVLRVEVPRDCEGAKNLLQELWRRAQPREQRKPPVRSDRRRPSSGSNWNCTSSCAFWFAKDFRIAFGAPALAPAACTARRRRASIREQRIRARRTATLRHASQAIEDGITLTLRLRPGCECGGRCGESDGGRRDARRVEEGPRRREHGGVTAVEGPLRSARRRRNNGSIHGHDHTCLLYELHRGDGVLENDIARRREGEGLRRLEACSLFCNPTRGARAYRVQKLALDIDAPITLK